MKQSVISKSLGNATDLTLMAPIRPGMVQSYELITYRTRLAAVLRTWQGLRSSAREQAAVAAFSDPVERIEAIHSFRLAMAPGPDRVILSVTFDHSWEPYIRQIWRDLGRMIDVLFCNTVTREGKPYPISTATPFADWSTWIRDHQVETGYFYNATALTVGDLSYLSSQERLRRDGGDLAAIDIQSCRATIVSAKARTRKVREEYEDDSRDQALKALTALHRLVRFYDVDASDPKGEGRLLYNAAHDLLQEWQPELLPESIKKAFKLQLDWFNQPVAALPPTLVAEAPDLGQVQAGIVTGTGVGGEPFTHGAFVFVQLPEDMQAAREWLRGLDITSESAAGETEVQRTIAFTRAGLARLRRSPDALNGWPQEFLEGAERRAPQLGDLRGAHPRRWTPPLRNWPGPAAGEVDLRAVDAVLQLRVRSASIEHEIVGNDRHPLFGEIGALQEQAERLGVTLLGVEAMRRADLARSESDHFGFADGISQPAPGAAERPGRKWQDRVNWGEVLVGYTNDGGDPPVLDPFRRNGSFLVVRRMRQHRDRLEALLATQPGIRGDDLVAKMLGRDRAGDPVVPARQDRNDFDYGGDEHGSACPFQAHIRRANPRGSRDAEQKPPRLLRRGMSYGPTWKAGDGRPRGVMFMAYCASIAEQYEVIQRWINGGNSSGVGSAQSDPLMGVPQTGEDRIFAFEHQGTVSRLTLKADEPLVELEWTAYFFVPSMAALVELAGGPPAPPWGEQLPAPASSPAPPPSALALKGEAIIKELFAAPGDHAYAAWQSVLDDVGARDVGLTGALWAAVREIHGGALRTPYGVLVGSRALCDQVLRSDRYSVGGYQGRARLAMGEIYLGLDESERYRTEAGPWNEAIGDVTVDRAFEEAVRATRSVLDEIWRTRGTADVYLDLLTQLVDPVLGALCRTYFGVPDGTHILPGGLDVSSRPGPPRCPGHYYSPSRYMFDPTPSLTGEEVGKRHGRALHDATLAIVADARRSSNGGLISGPMFARYPNDPAGNDLLARTLLGVMMGFLPTAAGNFIGIFQDWVDSRALWRLQALLPPAPTCAEAEAVLLAPLAQAMQRRPSPDMIWRTALGADLIGKTPVKPNDLIVIGIYSETQEAQLVGEDDIFPIFGGDRRVALHPVHACPGYRMAIGTMLGVMSAFLAGTTVRDTGVMLTLELSRRPS